MAQRRRLVAIPRARLSFGAPALPHAPARSGGAVRSHTTPINRSTLILVHGQARAVGILSRYFVDLPPRRTTAAVLFDYKSLIIAPKRPSFATRSCSVGSGPLVSVSMTISRMLYAASILDIVMITPFSSPNGSSPDTSLPVCPTSPQAGGPA